MSHSLMIHPEVAMRLIQFSEISPWNPPRNPGQATIDRHQSVLELKSHDYLIIIH